MDIEELIRSRTSVGEIIKGPQKGRFRFEGIQDDVEGGRYARLASLGAKTEGFGYDVRLDVLDVLVQRERRKPGSLRPATKRFHKVLAAAGVKPPPLPYRVDTTYVAFAEYLARPLIQLPPDDAMSETDDGDADDDPLRLVRARRGQREFRNKLKSRHLARCAITECRVWDLIEAAHIVPYSVRKDNRPSNGLLLRSDIHTLFDVGLLRIDPRTFTVRIGTRIRSSEYGAFDGKKLQLKRTKKMRANLQWRWDRS